MNNQRRVGIFLFTAAFLLFSTTARSQPGIPGSTPAPVKPETPQDSLGRTTPRGTVLGFLLAARKGDNEVATQYLNTRLRGKAANTLAHNFFVVLDRRLPARLSQLSDQPEGSVPFLTRPDQDLVGTISGDDGDVDIIVERVNRGKSGLVWLFSSKTLDAVTELSEDVGGVAVESIIPEFLVRTQIVGIPLFELLAVFVGLPLLYFFTALPNVLLNALVRHVRRHMLKRADLSTREFLSKPVRLLFLVVMIRWAVSRVSLPLLAREFWSNTATVILIGACVWILIQLNGLGEEMLRRHLVRLNRAGATSILRLGRRTIDVLLVFGGLLAALFSFGVNLTAALAGLGVGGIAIALAAQKTLENVIGGISVIFDQAVRVGDCVKVGENGGIVEDIGLRSTRIRTLGRSVVSVPNGQLANASLENISARDKFWFHHTLRLHYDTSAVMMRAALDEIEKLLAQHPQVEHSSVRVRFISLGTSSLDIEMFAYVRAGDWIHFLAVQQDLLLAVMAIVVAVGTRLAYPSQTLYLANSNGSSAPRAEALLHTAATESA